MILLPEAADLLVDVLKKSDFYSLAHGILFDHLQNLHSQGKEIDPVTIANSLRNGGELEGIGGLEYIIQLAEFVPNVEHGQTYADLILARSALRRLRRFAKDAAMIVGQVGDTPDQKLNRLEQQLNEVSASVLPASNSVVMLKDVMYEIEDHVLNGTESAAGFPSKFPSIQALIGGFEGGCVYTFGSRSGMGKTSYILEEALHLAKLGRPILFVTREMTPRRLLTRFVAKLSGVPLWVIKKRTFSAAQKTILLTVLDENFKLKVWFMSDTRTKISDIRRMARRIERDGGKMPIIFDDYIQMALNGSKNMHMEISQMMIDYKTMAKELDTPVLILSQLSRALERQESRRPSLADLKESGSIEENSDVVILIYRQEYYDARKEGRKERQETEAEFIVAKNREGGLGVAKLTFRPVFTEFSEAGK